MSLTLPASLTSVSRVKGVLAICDHISQWRGYDHPGRSDHVHFPAMCLLYHQGNLSQLQRHRPCDEQRVCSCTRKHTQKLRLPSIFYFHVYNILLVCVFLQALYVVLPGLLDCNPFPVDSSEPCWKGGVGFPEPVRRVLQVCFGFCPIGDENCWMSLDLMLFLFD